MRKRTCGLSIGPKGSMTLACSADVRAPVSTFALIAGSPRAGRATHSSHPSVKGDEMVLPSDVEALCTLFRALFVAYFAISHQLR